jgi:hypothetical protein
MATLRTYRLPAWGTVATTAAAAALLHLASARRPMPRHGPVVDHPRIVGSVPNWTVSWDLAHSTVIQPCNYSGLLDVSYLTNWAVVDIDWSNARAVWAATHPQTDEELLLAQARAVKAVNPTAHVWVYRQSVQAINSFTLVREKLDDPAYASWFLPFKPGGSVGPGRWNVPACDTAFNPPLCSAMYWEDLQLPNATTCGGPCNCTTAGYPCGNYLFDLRNASLRAWMQSEYLLGPTGFGSGVVSGNYFDDGWSPIQLPDTYGNYCDTANAIGGPTEVDANCIADMGLAWNDTIGLAASWFDNIAEMLAVNIAHGGFAWQGFFMVNTPSADAGVCALELAAACAPGSGEYTSATMFQLSTPYNSTANDERDIAYFLLVRGPYAWAGWGWIGCVAEGTTMAEYYPRPAMFDSLDVGTPANTCSETAAGSGVFVRNYTGVDVVFDCNTYTGSVLPKAGGLKPGYAHMHARKAAGGA